MQSVSSRIWTRVAVSISYNDNHYSSVNSLSAYIYNLKTIYVSLTKICQLTTYQELDIANNLK